MDPTQHSGSRIGLTRATSLRPGHNCPISTDGKVAPPSTGTLAGRPINGRSHLLPKNTRPTGRGSLTSSGYATVLGRPGIGTGNVRSGPAASCGTGRSPTLRTRAPGFRSPCLLSAPKCGAGGGDARAGVPHLRAQLRGGGVHREGRGATAAPQQPDAGGVPAAGGSTSRTRRCQSRCGWTRSPRSGEELDRGEDRGRFLDVGTGHALGRQTGGLGLKNASNRVQVCGVGLRAQSITRWVRAGGSRSTP